MSATQQVDSKSQANFPNSTGTSKLDGIREVPARPGKIEVALLTGGGDKPYALGMASALGAQGISIDFVGSDDLDVPELHRIASLKFLNLRGDQRTHANRLSKVVRILAYYCRLVHYAATAQPSLFHILWNNKFEFFDRTLLMGYYKLLGKRIVFTAHNVNAGTRDLKDTLLNRLTLRMQYRLADHIFVHTARMQQELIKDFNVPAQRVSVIPFGINNTSPNTALTTAEAKRKFGIAPGQKALLFFGNIAPYKGLDQLIKAFAHLVKQHPDYRLIVAGRPKACTDYWETIRHAITSNDLQDRVIQRIEYIPDEAVEEYFKAADVLVLPYKHIFQSGVLFLAYSFGLPVIASDVGSMKDDIIDGKTGFVFSPEDDTSLGDAIQNYFASELFENLGERRADIRTFANDRYSWDKVGKIVKSIYAELQRNQAHSIRPTI